MTPVYLGSGKNFMPGIMYQTEEEFKVCTGVSIEDTDEGPKVTYSTLTVTQGMPRALSMDETLIRFFLGRENMREVSKKFTSYTSQKVAFKRLFNRVNYTGPLKWCTWNFTGDVPVLILEDLEDEYLLATSINVCPKEISYENLSMNAAASVAKVPKEDVTEVLSEYVLKYYWCGDEVLKYLSKNNLDLYEYLDILWKNMA